MASGSESRSGQRGAAPGAGHPAEVSEDGLPGEGILIALDKFGFQIALPVAGIGVAGLGIGIALQGVRSNVVAGLTIIFTKPCRPRRANMALVASGRLRLSLTAP